MIFVCCGCWLAPRAARAARAPPTHTNNHTNNKHNTKNSDIKPENVLLTDDLQLKVADFGLAIALSEERAVTRVGE